MYGLERFRLNGDIVVVTGGTSRFGRHIVADVAETGAKVIATSRKKESAEDISRAHQARGREVEPAQLDLTEKSSIRDFYSTIEDKYGSVDGLVNNAINRPMSKLSDSLDSWDLSMECNARGVFELTRQFADNMSNHSDGSIVNVSSIQGMLGPDQHLYERNDMYHGHSPPPDYFFHKGGLINLTRYFASIYGEQGVRVNCVSPGGIKSENQDEAFVKRYSRRTALGRLARGQDLSGVIVFLLSDAAAYITGANIPVDGGYTSK